MRRIQKAELKSTRGMVWELAFVIDNIKYRMGELLNDGEEE